MGSLSSSISSQLATTVFRGGAKDIVPTKDVYSITNPSVINTNVDRYTGFSTDFLGSLTRNSSGLLSGLVSSTSLSNTGSLSFNNSLVTSRMQGVLGSPITNLSSSLQSTLAQSLGLRAADYNSMTLTVGSSISRLTNGNAGDLTSIVGAINTLTGNSKLASFLDVGSTAAAVSAITRQLIGLGVPQAVDAMMTKIDNADVAQAALIDNVQAAVLASDLDTLQLIINKTSVGNVLSKVPNAAQQLIQAYDLPTGTTAAQYAEQATKLVNILNQLDPTWATYSRGATVDSSLKYFGVASADALTVLATQEPYRLAAMIGNTYRPQDVVAGLKRLYPNMLTY